MVVATLHVLCDHVRISETGLKDGDQLSLLLASFAPRGNYSYDTGCGVDRMTIKADFGDDGVFNITITTGPETLRWHILQSLQCQGTVQMEGSSEFRMIINAVERKHPHFVDWMRPGSELRGKIDLGCNQVYLSFPMPIPWGCVGVPLTAVQC
eukprot:Skav232220  [mRNA]  locus=scaffold2626:546620:547343:+ [translate_table: standard]